MTGIPRFARYFSSFRFFFFLAVFFTHLLVFSAVEFGIFETACF